MSFFFFSIQEKSKQKTKKLNLFLKIFYMWKVVCISFTYFIWKSQGNFSITFSLCKNKTFVVVSNFKLKLFSLNAHHIPIDSFTDKEFSQNIH